MGNIFKHQVVRPFILYLNKSRCHKHCEYYKRRGLLLLLLLLLFNQNGYFSLQWGRVRVDLFCPTLSLLSSGLFLLTIRFNNLETNPCSMFRDQGCILSVPNMYLITHKLANIRNGTMQVCWIFLPGRGGGGGYLGHELGTGVQLGLLIPTL